MPPIGRWDEFTLERFIQDLIDRDVASALVTTLPTNPVDGQEIAYLADATNGIVWRLKYRAKSVSAYKWEYIGGSALYAAVQTGEAKTLTTYGDLATVGPSITLPFGGDYDVSVSLRMDSAANEAGWAAVKLGAAATSDNEGAAGFMSGTGTSASRRLPLTGRPAGEVLKLEYRTSSGGSVSFRGRSLHVTPVRLG